VVVTTDSPALFDTFREVGGYRVVRQLAADGDSITLLVHDDDQPLIARVVSENCPRELIDQEVAVSDAVRAGSDALQAHVGALRDLGTTPDGRLVLLSEYVDGPRLDALLHERHGELTLGEAVTLLAPLATTIDDGHRVGVTGLVRGMTGVRLRRSGAPVLVGLRYARVGAAVPERFQHRDPAYAHDREQWNQLGAAVAAALPEPERSALLALLARHSGGVDRALFDLAEPLPVRFTRADAVSAPSDPGPAARTVIPPPEHSAVAPVGASAVASTARRERLDSAVSAIDALGLPETVIGAVRSAAFSLLDRVEGLIALGHRVRPTPGGAVRSRYRLVGLAGVAALAATIIVASLPSDDQRDTATEPSAGSGDTQGSAIAHETSLAVAGLPETELHPEADEWRGIVEQLVERWLACAPIADDDRGDPQRDDLRGLSLSCAVDVVHAGSAAARLITVVDDRHGMLRSWSSAQGDIVVVERMGSAVLVDLLAAETTTASLLLVRSEAGWRIRDVIG